MQDRQSKALSSPLQHAVEDVMSLKTIVTAKRVPFTSLLLVGALGISSMARADSLTMRNGTTLEGSYAGGSGQTVKFVAPVGTAEIDTKNVVSLSFTGQSPATPATGTTDTLSLKNGTVLQGSYAGGTAKTVKFVSPMGSLEVKSKDVKSISFTATPGAAPAGGAAPTASAAAAPTAHHGSITVPVGTVLLTRTIDPVSSNDKAGKLFGLVLDGDLMVGGKVVAKAGTKLYGKVEESTQAGRVAGKADLIIGLDSIEIGGSRVAVKSDAHMSTGEGSMKKTARRAILGTAIGGAVGGRRGAGRGAGAGAATTLLTPGQVVGVAPKTLLHFTLEAPLTIPGA
jgi:hypothetical protein